MRLIHFSKNLPANFKIFLSNFENCKFCQRVGLAPLVWIEFSLLLRLVGVMNLTLIFVSSDQCSRERMLFLVISF